MLHSNFTRHSFAKFVFQHPPVGDKVQTTAEQDMEIIRTKRATSAAGGPAATGQPKSKYRKRSVSMFRAMVWSNERLILFVPAVVRPAGDPTREVPFLQYTRDPRVEAWA